MQRAAIVSSCDFPVGLRGLALGQLLSLVNDASQERVVFLQPLQVALGQLSAADLPRANQFRQLRDWQEAECFIAGWAVKRCWS